MKKNLILLAAFAAVSAGAAAADAPLWLRDAAISPDGKNIAFTYKGDIYKVSTNGGSAVRLTTMPSVESRPVWSPDGKSIAFASDRNGGQDIFIMSAAGGEAVRLTDKSAIESPQAFTPDGIYVIYTANIQDPASSVFFPTTRQTEIYKVPVAGGRPEQVLAASVDYLSFAGNDGSFLYEDVKGSEDRFRKHHTSSVTSDVWMYNPKSQKYTNLTNRPGNDRNPRLSPDGKTVYILSERDDRNMNVYSFPLDNPSQVTQETNFKTHPVRFLSVGNDGTLAFTYDGELYVRKPGQKTPSKVNVSITNDASEGTKTMSFSGGRGAIASPDGKEIAYTVRGEVFVTSVKHGTTKQITHTPEGECDVVWGKDGRELYYTSERDGKFNIYKATIGREDDPNFSNATVINEVPVFSKDGKERTNPSISPDGKKLAFVENRNNLMVMDLGSKSVKQLTNGNTVTGRSHGFDAQWSPDSKWLLIEYNDYRHEPYSDIAIINASTGELIKLTATGYFDENPKWALDGNAVVFMSERYGMRNHASWGSEFDVMITFLNKDAYDKFRLSEEDYELLKELEKTQAKQKKAAEGKKENAEDKKDKADETKDIVVDRDGIRDRVIRLTPASGDISDAVITNDGKTLYYVLSTEGSSDLWKKDLRKGDVKLVTKLGSPAGFQNLKDGKEIFLLGSRVRKLDPAGDKLTPVSISGSLEYDPAKERKYMYDYMTREARERFLFADMGGVDWEGYTKHYAKFLPHINNNVEFARLLSEVLGELNVSHSGGRYSAAPAKKANASLGLLYDMDYSGPGLKVAEIVAGGPFDRATTSIVPGSVITAIDGKTLEADKDPLSSLLGLRGDKTLVSFTTPAGKKLEEVVIPISGGAFNNLLYERWVKARAAEVDRLSIGRLGYVHIQGMNDNSFRKIYSQLLGEYVGKEGIVIDTRWNGGGRLHEDIEVLFSGEKYLTQEAHGRTSAEMPSRRWNRPSIMVIGEANYSNAHGTPWVYKHKNLGKLVGMPVPGTMSSVNWITMQDPTMVFGVPVIAFRTAEGNVLENTQLEPDVKVALDPNKALKGEDTQLKAAVETLLHDIDAAKKK
ncbi:MAG: PD40 domain-containing protein [Muribaculaceae bacterium]|nr:PD40 domain-containing protein [Muribaculaceae bacterium]